MLRSIDRGGCENIKARLDTLDRISVQGGDGLERLVRERPQDLQALGALVEYLWDRDREKGIQLAESWANREETGDSLFWLGKARGEKGQTEESSRLLGRAYSLAMETPVLRYDRLGWIHYA